MELKKLTDGLAVGPQIGVEDLPELARRGFKAILGNRPEAEGSDQPRWEELAAAARRHGLEARQVPVIPGQIRDDDVKAFRQAISQLPKPIAAFCRTGARSTMLWALANPDGLNTDERVRAAADHGYDISSLRARLDENA